MRPAAAIAVGLAGLAVALSGDGALAEAWLTGFLLCAGLAAGALGALATGHLLREDWLAPVRAPLQAAALTMPLVALMALPVLAVPELLYPWAGADPPPMPAPRAAWFQPWPFRLRGAVALAAWIAMALLLARPGVPGKRAAALALGVLAISVSLAAQDWSLSRDATWWGSLQGFSVWVEGVMAALAAAALVAIARGGMPDGETGPGEATERALLALGLAVLWLWFTQFIVVWMADLPEEAAWYLRRTEDGWGIAKLGAAVPMLLLALALAAPPRHRRWRMATVCALLLAVHLVHLWWAVRPDAPLARPSPALDGGVALALAAAWAGWWWAALRRQLSPVAAADPGLRPARASAR